MELHRFTAALAGVVSLFLLALVPAVANAEETWNGYLGSPQGNPVRASQPASRLAPSWDEDSLRVSLDTAFLSAGGGQVFTTFKDPDSQQLETVALDAESGQEAWSYGNYAELPGCPLFHDGTLYVGYKRASDNRWAVAALDASDGAQEWEHELPVGTAIGYGSGLAYSGSKVFLFTQESGLLSGGGYRILALDATDGTESWSRPGRPTGDAGPPTLSGSTVIVAKPEDSMFGTPNGLAAYSVADGQDLGWNTPSTDHLFGAAAKDGVLYHLRRSGGNSNVVVARSVADGSQIWSKSVGAAFSISNLVVADGRVYVLYGGPGDFFGSYRVNALSAVNGDPLWPEPFARAYLSTYLMKLGKWLYAGADLVGSRHMLDPATGEVVGKATGFAGELDPKGQFAYVDGQFFWWETIKSGDNAGAYALKSFADIVPPELSVETPADGAYKSSEQLVSWVADDGFDTPLDRVEVSIDGGVAQVLDGSQTETLLSQLADGEHEILVRAFDLAGMVSEVKRQIEIISAPFPMAALVGPGGPVLSGTPLTLDASGSTDAVLDGQIVKFEWDLDGNGSFETDGGVSPELDTEFKTAGVRSLAVRVTNDSGNSDTAAVSVDVRRKPLPGAGAVGVSINDAAIFTNDPNVKLRIKWPALATDLAVSNDGGFATSSSFPLPANGIIGWKLDSSGPERLPKTVYVRYYGAGNDTVTFTDDIILDETPPAIQQAELISTGGSATAIPRSREVDVSASARKKPVRIRIRLKARDSTSGIVAIQVARSRKVRGPVVQTGRRAKRLSKIINPRVRFRPRLIRVKDAAGNWTKLRKVR